MPFKTFSDYEKIFFCVDVSFKTFFIVRVEQDIQGGFNRLSASVSGFDFATLNALLSNLLWKALCAARAS